MLAVNQNIIDAYNNYTTQRKSYIRVGNNSFFIQNLDIVADCYEKGNIIGNAIAKIAKFDIETNNVIGLDEFEIFDGIWTGNQYEYISLGTFKLFDEEGTDDFFSSVTAYDKLVLFNKEYNPNDTIYPITLYGLLENICLQAGLQLENDSIANGEKIIEENLFVENETLKNVLNGIAQISGNFAVISNDTLKLLLKTDTSLQLVKSQISDPEFKRTTWEINQVVLGMSDIEGEYVKFPNDAEITGNIHKLIINDNPFVYTQELREAYIQDLYNQVNGFGYIAFSTKWEGLPFVELGDSIIVDGRESIILRYNLKSPKGLDSTLEAPSIIDSVINYIDNSKTIENRLSRTEYFVDKANRQISAIVSETQNLYDEVREQSDEIDNLNETTLTLSNQVTQTNQDLQVSISRVEQQIENGVENVRNSLVTININGIEVSANTSIISTIMKNDKFAIKNADMDLFFVGYDYEQKKTVSEIDNLTVKSYFTAGYHRQEKFEPEDEERTGWFFVGGVN